MIGVPTPGMVPSLAAARMPRCISGGAANTCGWASMSAHWVEPMDR
jgi:hypothetical protein